MRVNVPFLLVCWSAFASGALIFQVFHMVLRVLATIGIGCVP
jgi:hypothetical protein